MNTGVSVILGPWKLVIAARCAESDTRQAKWKTAKQILPFPGKMKMTAIRILFVLPEAVRRVQTRP